MFYTKTIDILGFADGETNEYGMYVKGEEQTLDTIKCDVQPITRQLANKEYGLDEDVDYTIFCDPHDSLGTSIIIKYNDKNYKIKEVVKWDDYWILIVGDTDVS